MGFSHLSTPLIETLIPIVRIGHNQDLFILTYLSDFIFPEHNCLCFSWKNQFYYPVVNNILLLFTDKSLSN